jgi:hypothetical protein
MSATLPCPHLAPAIEPLLRAGAQNIGVAPANGEFRFVHQLSKGATLDSGRKLAEANGVRFWVNDDSHNAPLDCGFACSKCAIAVAWLQEKATIAI